MITFSTHSHADISMFDAHAKELLSMMGHSGRIPGALLAEDLPEVLERLRQRLENARLQEQEGHKGTDEDTDKEDERVSMGRRAWPLVQLLQAAVDHDDDVMWE